VRLAKRAAICPPALARFCPELWRDESRERASKGSGDEVPGFASEPCERAWRIEPRLVYALFIGDKSRERASKGSGDEAPGFASEPCERAWRIEPRLVYVLFIGDKSRERASKGSGDEVPGLINGRGERIRTSDPSVPKRPSYPGPLRPPQRLPRRARVPLRLPITAYGGLTRASFPRLSQLDHQFQSPHRPHCINYLSGPGSSQRETQH